MSNNLNIREVLLSQISDVENTVNGIGHEVLDGIKQARQSAYEPIVVRVTDHPADTVDEEDDATLMALFVSRRHGEPWIMQGHQTEHLIHPVAGAEAAVIVDIAAYSVIYPNFDYSTFE